MSCFAQEIPLKNISIKSSVFTSISTMLVIEITFFLLFSLYQRRWEFVRKAVRRVVVYDLPNGAEVAVVVFNAKDKAAAPLSTVVSGGHA